MEIDWEMSGVPEHDILLAPMNLKAWDSQESVSREQQIEILHALRIWLASKKIRSDIEPINHPIVSASKCAWSGCGHSAIEKAVYCVSHYDENLLQ